MESTSLVLPARGADAAGESGGAAGEGCWCCQRRALMLPARWADADGECGGAAGKGR
jgi:hypothetical protein